MSANGVSCLRKYVKSWFVLRILSNFLEHLDVVKICLHTCYGQTFVKRTQNAFTHNKKSAVKYCNTSFTNWRAI